MREYVLKNRVQEVTEVQIYSGEYLENLGFIFLIDFGFSNAVDKSAHAFTDYLDEQKRIEMNGY
jgi:hypothetical protein